MIGAVVLAAGRSRRMGACKTLLPVGGVPMITRLVRALAECAVSEILVVAAADAPAIAAALEGLPARLVRNPDPDSAMLDSVRCGLRALPAGCQAALIVPGDQARLAPDIIRPLLAAFAQGSHGLVVPLCRGRRGHPLLVARRHFAETLTGLDDTGLRGLLRRHPEDVREVPVEHPGVLDDVDTPEDYQRLRERG